MCHLCQDARAVVYSVLPPGAGMREVNIDSDATLKERYGLRIPVFAVLEDGELAGEKGWPFSPGQIRRMIEART